jgi:hypothetical protein
MAALGPLVGSIAGVESRPIQFEIDGLKRTVRAEDLVDQACEGAGVASGSAPDQAIALDTAVHPVSRKLFLAKATRSLFNVFGIKWDDSIGTRNAHFAPFAWAG